MRDLARSAMLLSCFWQYAMSDTAFCQSVNVLRSSGVSNCQWSESRTWPFPTAAPGRTLAAIRPVTTICGVEILVGVTTTDVRLALRSELAGTARTPGATILTSSSFGVRFSRPGYSAPRAKSSHARSAHAAPRAAEKFIADKSRAPSDGLES